MKYNKVIMALGIGIAAVLAPTIGAEAAATDLPSEMSVDDLDSLENYDEITSGEDKDENGILQNMEINRYPENLPNVDQTQPIAASTNAPTSENQNLLVADVAITTGSSTPNLTAGEAADKEAQLTQDGYTGVTTTPDQQNSLEALPDASQGNFETESAAQAYADSLDPRYGATVGKDTQNSLEALPDASQGNFESESAAQTYANGLDARYGATVGKDTQNSLEALPDASQGNFETESAAQTYANGLDARYGATVGKDTQNSLGALPDASQDGFATEALAQSYADDLDSRYGSITPTSYTSQEKIEAGTYSYDSEAAANTQKSFLESEAGGGYEQVSVDKIYTVTGKSEKTLYTEMTLEQLKADPDIVWDDAKTTGYKVIGTDDKGNQIKQYFYVTYKTMYNTGLDVNVTIGDQEINLRNFGLVGEKITVGDDAHTTFLSVDDVTFEHNQYPGNENGVKGESYYVDSMTLGNAKKEDIQQDVSQLKNSDGTAITDFKAQWDSIKGTVGEYIDSIPISAVISIGGNGKVTIQKSDGSGSVATTGSNRKGLAIDTTKATNGVVRIVVTGTNIQLGQTLMINGKSASKAIGNIDPSSIIWDCRSYNASTGKAEGGSATVTPQGEVFGVIYIPEGTYQKNSGAKGGSGQVIAAKIYGQRWNSVGSYKEGITSTNIDTYTTAWDVTAPKITKWKVTAGPVEAVNRWAVTAGPVAAVDRWKVTAEAVNAVDRWKVTAEAVDAVDRWKVTAEAVDAVDRWQVTANAVEADERFIVSGNLVETTYYYGVPAPASTTTDPGTTPTTTTTPATPATPFTFTFTAAPTFAAAPAATAAADVAAPAVFTPAPAAAPAAAPAQGVLGANRPLEASTPAAPASVLGQQRSTGSVLGARRDADTADASSMMGWLSAFAASSSILGAWTLGKKKREED
ncbi:MAG: hypothetical protein K6E75_02820 [Lachnospiraceae bacterium]|nr:hypothetical protein [Lachnospiraceae bacterium]